MVLGQLDAICTDWLSADWMQSGRASSWLAVRAGSRLAGRNLDGLTLRWLDAILMGWLSAGWT